MRRALSILLALAMPLPGLVAADWTIEHSRGLAGKQRGDLTIALHGTRVFSHAFRTRGLRLRKGRPIDGRLTALITVAETPGTEWDANPMREIVDDRVPASIGFLVQDGGDWASAGRRWFSTARLPLTPGTHLLTAPIAAPHWTNVYGKPVGHSRHTRAAWRTIWRSPGARIGLCAGGHFYGHGVAVKSGSATITVHYLTLRHG